MAPAVARDFLRRSFRAPVLVLAPGAYGDLLDLASESGIAGGAIYDAVVAATAREARVTLLTLDRRAVATYAAVGADYELVAG